VLIDDTEGIMHVLHYELVFFPFSLDGSSSASSSKKKTLSSRYENVSKSVLDTATTRRLTCVDGISSTRACLLDSPAEYGDLDMIGDVNNMVKTVSCRLHSIHRDSAHSLPLEHTDAKHHLGGVVHSPLSCAASSRLTPAADHKNVDDLAHVKEQKVVDLVAGEVGKDQLADVEFQRRAAI
jgi:hypothetical protein